MKFISPSDLKFRCYDSKNGVIDYFTLDTYSATKHFDKEITRCIDTTDTNGIDVYEGDIVKWDKGMWSLEGLSDDIKQKANQTLQDWLNSDKSIDYDYAANGWYKLYDIGVVVFYKGGICIHNDFSTDYHAKNSKYNGTTFYGSYQKNKNYTVVGNIYKNAHLLVK